ncbi:MAG TPA: mechanosensitive ion channel domain-containing protein [Gemmatimonadaceae bacterium]|nr:mechanosensitive ion channel domain-containing protein [Gemmatimonadaceae bacterium]
MENPELVGAMRESLPELAAWFRVHQMKLLGAAVLLAAGLLLGLLLREVVSRLIRAVGRIVPERLLRHGVPRPSLKREAADGIGLVVFWAVFLFFVAAAVNLLGLPVLGASLAAIVAYVPRLIGAALILVAGLLIGNLAREAAAAAAAAAGSPFALAIGQIVRGAILVAAGLLAVAELGIDITLLTAILSVTLLAVLGAFALAFGLGAREAVSNIIGAHYVRQTFEIGQRVRIGEIEGTIAAITATSVILQSAQGRVVIPARLFSETVAMVLTPGGVG